MHLWKALPLEFWFAFVNFLTDFGIDSSLLLVFVLFLFFSLFGSSLSTSIYLLVIYCNRYLALSLLSQVDHLSWVFPRTGTHGISTDNLVNSKVGSTELKFYNFKVLKLDANENLASSLMLSAWCFTLWVVATNLGLWTWVCNISLFRPVAFKFWCTSEWFSMVVRNTDFQLFYRRFLIMNLSYVSSFFYSGKSNKWWSHALFLLVHFIRYCSFYLSHYWWYSFGFLD